MTTREIDDNLIEETNYEEAYTGDGTSHVSKSPAFRDSMQKSILY